MKKNVASQSVVAEMVSATDGSAFTGSVTCYVTGDNGTQAAGSVGSGACTHKGNGLHRYGPAQAETNYDHVAFTFVGTGAVPVTVQIYTSFPQTGDSYARLGAPAGADIATDIAALPTAAENADAVWDEARSGHTTTGTFGGDAVDSADLVDSIWDEAQSGHTTAGTFGKYLDSAISGVSTGGVTAADIADAVLDEALSGHTTAGTLGKAVSDILDDTGTSGVIVDTNNDKTGYSLATAPLDEAGVRSAIGLASANLDTQLGDIPTATENADALLKRDMSSVSGESSRSPLNALRALRNKVSVSGTTLTVTKEDDSTSAWTATVTTDETANPITAVDPA